MVHKRPCGAALSAITASTVLFAQYDPDGTRGHGSQAGTDEY